MGFPLNDFPDACLILNDKNQVVGINPAGERLLNSKLADIAGKSVSIVHSDQSISIHFNAQDKADLDPDNEPDHFLTSLYSLCDDAGKPLGQITIIRGVRTTGQDDSLRKQNAILTALQETTIELHASLDLNVVLHHIVERACKLLGTTNGYLDILNEYDELEPVIGIGSLAHSLKFKVAKGEGIAGIVWQTGKPLVTNDYDRWEKRIEKYPERAIRAAVGIPLLRDSKVVGVIGIGHNPDSDVSISDDDVFVLERFADLAVLALENARTYAKAQKEIEFRRATEIQLRNANQVLKLQIEKIELLQRDLQELAVRDPLTELYNRRYLTEVLELELTHPERSKYSFAILMMDSDHLKGINDKYGHKAGDDFLVQISDVLKDDIRAGDIACRYGGDEFVVVMNNVSMKNAIDRAEELRKTIAEKSIVYRSEGVNISVSVGIALFPGHGRTGEELLQRADLALYEAKRLGKNRVIVFSESLKE